MRRDILIVIMILTGLGAISFTYMPGRWHEWLGLTVAVVVAVHCWLHRRWFGSILKGPYDGWRYIVTGSQLVVAVCVILAVVTGIIGSNYLFRDSIPIEWHHNSSVRMWHSFFVWVSVPLLGFHCGLFGKALMMRWARYIPVMPHAAWPVVKAVGKVGIIVAALYSMVEVRWIDRILLRHVFGLITDEPIWPVFILEIISIAGAGALLGNKVGQQWRRSRLGR